MLTLSPTVRPTPARGAVPRVVDCYSVSDAILPACGFHDLTDGMYEGDPHRDYEAAQARQAEVLLDRAGVGPGARLLDIGCGYGRLLKAGQARGAFARGITISPEQHEATTRDGLDVLLRNYRQLGARWNGQFDAVIANGSLEHFAQPADAAAGRDDAVYHDLFVLVHRLLDPARPAARFVTTAIHFRERPDPRDLLAPPAAHRRGSAAFHWARLAWAFGGWYPVRGQLEACARGLFRLVDEEDGTDDYRRTSETWLAGVRRQLWSLGLFPLARRTASITLRRPLATVRMLRCMLGSQSWNWQFRGDPTPALLLRQTWERV